MNIIQINETCGIGSTGRTTLELAEYLEAHGHSAFVFCAHSDGRYPNCSLIGNAFDRKLHALLSRITGRQGAFSALATRRMLDRLKALRPDVVHLRNLHGNYINLGMLLRFLARNDIPTVLTLHDCWFMTGKCTHYVGVNCQKWRTQCNACPLLHIDNVNPTWFLDRTARCFSDKKRWFQAIPRLGVAGVSRWVRDEAEQSFLGDRHPVTIYNWIDSKVFYPRDARAVREKYGLGNGFVALMVAQTLDKSKGYDVFLRLAEALGPDGKAVFVGGNELHHLPIPPGAVHIPRTNDARELAALYSAADVCVNTTQAETFGKVTAEALCCGTPVIVYNNTASPELVGENCGYVTEEKDGPEGVLAAVNQIRRRGKAAYTEDCLAFARERFSLETGAEKYLRLYENLMNMAKQPKHQ